jgi:hypothetical protein
MSCVDGDHQRWRRGRWFTGRPTAIGKAGTRQCQPSVQSVDQLNKSAGVLGEDSGWRMHAVERLYPVAEGEQLIESRVGVHY